MILDHSIHLLNIGTKGAVVYLISQTTCSLDRGGPGFKPHLRRYLFNLI